MRGSRWWPGRRAGGLLFLLGAGLAHAQTGSAPETAVPTDSRSEENPASDELGADEPEVHSQVASFAVTQLRATPAVVTSISAEELRDSGARDLMDALIMVPGFFFGEDLQGMVGPGFRGLWGQEGKVLLLIDGKEMNEQLYSTLQLGHEFPIELIERIEVVRGPGSVIYGGNAELAVINVLTRGVQGSTDFQVTGSYGQYATSNARRSLTLSGRKVFESVPGLSALVSASLGQGQRSDAEYRDFFGGAASMAGQSRLDPTVVQAAVGYRDIQLSLLYHRLNTTSVVGVDAVLPSPVRTDFEAFHGELSGRFRPIERLEIIPRLNVSVQTPYRVGDLGSEFYYDKQVRRVRGRVSARWAALDYLQLTGGADVFLDQGQLLGPEGIGLQTPFTGTGERVSYTNVAGFIEAYSENPIVTFVAGARYDNHSAFGASFVPRLVLLRSFGPLSAKALFSRAFRAPSVENISLGENIRPERTTVFELEGRLRLGPGQTVGVNAFDVGIQQPIAYSFDPETNTEAYRNLGRVGSRGVELDYGLHGRWGRLALSYSFYTPTTTDVPDYQVPGHGNVYTGLPAHKATLAGGVKVLPWLSINPTAVLVGERYAVGAPDETGESLVEKQPAQLLLNLFVRAQNVGTRGLEVGAGIYNLLGADFRVAQPYSGGAAPLPVFSRELFVRLSYHFEPTGEDEPASP